MEGRKEGGYIHHVRSTAESGCPSSRDNCSVRLPSAGVYRRTISRKPSAYFLTACVVAL